MVRCNTKMYMLDAGRLLSHKHCYETHYPAIFKGGIFLVQFQYSDWHPAPAHIHHWLHHQNTATTSTNTRMWQTEPKGKCGVDFHQFQPLPQYKPSSSIKIAILNTQSLSNIVGLIHIFNKKLTIICLTKTWHKQIILCNKWGLSPRVSPTWNKPGTRAMKEVWPLKKQADVQPLSTFYAQVFYIWKFLIQMNVKT